MSAPGKYPEELRERATRMAVEARRDPEGSKGAIRRIAEGAGRPPGGPARSGRDRSGRPAGNHHRRGAADRGAGVGGARAGGGPMRSCAGRARVCAPGGV